MSDNELKEFFCPVCKRKVFHGKFFGRIEVKCGGCRSVVRFDIRPRSPTDMVAVEKIADDECIDT